MAFWGVEVKPGKASPFVPSMDQAAKLHLSQACLGPQASKGQKAALAVKVGDGEPLLVCSLREGSLECCNLDLIIDSYAEFSVVGAAPIHLTGYFMPEYEIEGQSDEDDEMGADPYGQIIGFDDQGLPIMAGEYDSEEDSDYEQQSDDDEGAMLLGSDAEEGDSEEEEDSEDEQPQGRRDVIIEEITEEDEKQQQQQQGKGQANGKASAKQQAFADDDVEASDEEEEEEDVDDDDEEEQEEEQEEEEKEEEEQQQAKAAAEARAKAGEKRKAEAPPSKKEQQAAKQQRQDAAAAAKQQQQQQEKKGKQQQKEKEQKDRQQQQEKNADGGKAKVREFPNGFKIEELKQGPPGGKLAKGGRKVVVKYIGKLKSGKVFDQTLGNKTFTFRLGVGEVIKGWDRGVEGMRVGDKRRLTVPPQMGYGSAGVKGAIPPNSTLIFDVELIDVR